MNVTKPAAVPRTPIVEDILDKPVPRCEVVERPNGSAFCTIIIDPHLMKRIKIKAGRVAIDRWLWENVIYRALCDGAY